MRVSSRRSLLASLLVACALPWFAGCPAATPGAGDPTQSGGTKRIVFLINIPDPYWEANLQGLNEGAKMFDLASAGLSVTQDPGNGTTEGQIEKLRQYATQDDIVGVAISPWDADSPAIVEELQKLQKKGVKVITVDNDVNREKYRDSRSFYLGTDNLIAGQALGTGLNAVLDAKGVKSGNFVQFVGNTESDNARARMDGVKDKIGADFVEVAREADGSDTGRAKDNVRNTLLNHKDIVALVGIWAYNAPAITGVLQETNNTGKIVVGTFDAQELAIEAMAKKEIDVMVVQNPFDMGVQTVRLMKAMIQDDQATIKEMFPKQGEPDGDMYTTGLRIVVPDESSPIKKELYEEGVVEFMTLAQFREWLTKFGLKSS